MVESISLTGSRDDLRIDTSRCLRMRYSDSSCHRCVDACPHGAVTLDDGLTVDPELCRGCLLCTSVCPVGALEQALDFSACLAKLSKVPAAVLGCVRTTDCSNATMVCLGGLSEEHLLVLSHTVTGSVTLNLSLCRYCPNNPVIVTLKEQLAALSVAGLPDGAGRIVIAESAGEVRYRDVSLNRRGFFTSIRASLFSSAADILTTQNEQSERQTEYAVKRVPTRRKLLNSIRYNLDQESEERIRRNFDSCISFDEHCTRCQGCVAICPTGALKTVTSDDLPAFEQPHCTGCGLCREFCLDGALHIRATED